MTSARDYRTVKNNFRRRSVELQAFFEHLPSLLDSFPAATALAYMAQRIEIGDRDALRAALMIRNQVEVRVARKAVDEHMSRGAFRDRFERSFGGHPRPKTATVPLNAFESTRDRVLHGRTVSTPEIYTALIRGFDYAQAMNKFSAHHLGGFQPFSRDRSSLRGGRPYCNPTISCLIARGLGFFGD